MASMLKIECFAEGEKFPLIMEFEIDDALYNTIRGLKINHSRFLIARKGDINGLIIPTAADKNLLKWS